MNSFLVVFGIVCAALTPTITLIVSRHFDKKERAAVAEKVEAVAVQAEVVEGRVGEVATSFGEFREEQAVVAVATSEKLDTIHGLVDGQLTTAMMSELAALVDRRATMIELKELKESGGLKPTKDALEAIAQSEAKIAELRVQIAKRVTEQTAADARARAAAEQAKVPLSRRLPEGGG